MKLFTAFVSVLVLLALSAGICTAQVTLNAQNMQLEEAATELTKQVGIQIICDTGIKATVSGSFTGIELEALLDIITKANSLKWQKLYIPAQAEKKPTLAEIKAQADAVAALADMPLVIYDPVTKKQSMFVRQAPDNQPVSTEKLGLTPLYLISSIQAAKAEKKTGDDAYSRYQELQQERMDALMDMNPEQRVAALQQELMSQLGMDPDQRAAMMRDQFAARNNLPPGMRDQYRDMMRDTFRTLREQGGLPDWGRGDRGPRGDRGGERRERTN